MKNVTLLVIILISIVSAQSVLGVRYPGGLSTAKSGLSSRMGGFGIGSSENYLMMAHNPGNLGNITHSVYSLKFTLDYTRVIENDLTSDFVVMVPDLVGFAFPLGNAGTFALSFSKERGNKYTYISEPGVISTNPVTNDSLTGWTGLYRKTATTAWEVGWGHKAWKFFRPGLTYRRFYFNFEDNTVAKIDNYGGKGDTIQATHAGNAIRGGFSGTMGKLTYGLTATYNFEGEMDFDRHLKTYSIDGSSAQVHEDAKIDTKYRIQLPPSGGVGLSYQLNDQLLLGVDYSMEFWEDAWTDAPTSVFYTQYTNTQSGSFGVQFIPAPKLLSPRYFEKIRYSLGARATTLPIDGDWEAAGTVGFGLPLGSAGLLDIAFEGGTRRSTDFDTIQENFFRFSISTSGGKQWRKKSNIVY